MDMSQHYKPIRRWAAINSPHSTCVACARYPSRGLAVAANTPGQGPAQLANGRTASYYDVGPSDLRQTMGPGLRQRDAALEVDIEPYSRVTGKLGAEPSQRAHERPSQHPRRDPSMAAILESRTLDQLRDALANNERFLLPTHLSAALNMLPKVRFPRGAQLQRDRLLAQLLSDVCHHRERLNTRSLASAIWSIAKLGAMQHLQEVQLLLQELWGSRGQEVQCNAALLASLGWSLGTLQYQDAATWQQLLECSIGQLHNFRPLDCAQLSVGLARCPQQQQQQDQVKPLLQGIVDRATATLQNFTPQNISNLLWAMATLQQPCPQLSSRVVEKLQLQHALQPFKPQELSTLAWAYAKLRSVSSTVQRRLQRQMHQEGGDGSARGSSGSEQETQAADWVDDAAEDVAQDVAVSLSQQLELGPSHSSTAGNSSNSSSNSSSSLLGQQQGASSTTGSLAAEHSAFCASLTAQVAELGASSFRSEELTMLSWALAKLGRQHCPAGLLDQIAAAATSRAGELGLKEMCCISWALATLGSSHPGMLQALVPQALPKVCPETAQESLQLLFACAKLKQPCPELCAAWAEAALPSLPSWRPKQLAMALWSLAQLGALDDATFRVACRQAQRHVRGCAPAFLSLISSAVGTAQRLDPLLMLALAGEVKGRLRDLPADVVSIFVWATARVSFYDEELCGLVAAAAAEAAAATAADGADATAAMSAVSSDAASQQRQQQQQQWNAHSFSTVAWALASHRHYDSGLLNALAAHIAAHVDSYQWTDLCRSAFAFAVLQHHNPVLLAAIARVAVKRQASLDPQGACLLAWSFATLGQLDLPLFQACYGYYEGLFRQKGCVVTREDDWAAQLFHADMMARLLASSSMAGSSGGSSSGSSRMDSSNSSSSSGDGGGGSTAGATPSSGVQQQQQQEQQEQEQQQQQQEQQPDSALPRLSPQLHFACFEAWRRRLGQLHISEAQQQVAQVLLSLGLKPLLECPAHQGLLSVDVLLVLRGGERVAVEVDGPDHFAANVQTHVLGPTAAKARDLQALGYTLVTVPVFEWDVLPTWQDRRDYLVAKLKGRHSQGSSSTGSLPGGFVSREVVSRRYRPATS